jgi:Zn-dependent protease
MTDSVQLGRLFSVPIGLHWSVAVLAAVFGFTLSTTILPAVAPGYGVVLYAVTALVTAVALLAAIVAHELGHSIEARRDGIPVQGITLFALGGVAKLDGDPSTPRAAGRIAVAGPVVSLVIGLAGLGAWWATSTLGLPALVSVALLWFGFANIVMAVFNMIPALPLDGGRALQAYLWHRNGDTDKATISAARVGRYLGWGIVALGLFSLLNGGSGLWTMLIGWFVVTGARGESLRARFRLRARNGQLPFWWQNLSAATQAPRPGGGPTGEPPSADPLGNYRRPQTGPVVDVP